MNAASPTPDPRAIWESLTPAQREAMREAAAHGTAVMMCSLFDTLAALGLMLLHSPKVDGYLVGMLTDLGRAVAKAGQEVDRG